MTNKIIAVFFYLLLCSTGHSQNIFLTGSVFDNNNRPIPLASVQVVGDNASATSDNDGIFSLKVNSGKKKGDVIGLTVSKKGFGTIYKQVAIAPELAINLKLVKNLVTAAKPATQNSPTAKIPSTDQKKSQSNQMIQLLDAREISKQSIATLLNEIVINTGLNVNFELVEASDPAFSFQSVTNNIFAFQSNGKKYIVYDINFLRLVKDTTGSIWPVLLMFAHEVSHHLFLLNEHTEAAPLKVELDADEFAGFILRRFDGPKESIYKIINYLKGVYVEDNFHPKVLNRQNSMLRGWERGKN
jgi:hypothetical protein